MRRLRNQSKQRLEQVAQLVMAEVHPARKAKGAEAMEAAAGTAAAGGAGMVLILFRCISRLDSDARAKSASGNARKEFRRDVEGLHHRGQDAPIQLGELVPRQGEVPQPGEPPGCHPPDPVACQVELLQLGSERTTGDTDVNSLPNAWRRRRFVHCASASEREHELRFSSFSFRNCPMHPGRARRGLFSTLRDWNVIVSGLQSTEADELPLLLPPPLWGVDAAVEGRREASRLLLRVDFPPLLSLPSPVRSASLTLDSPAVPVAASSSSAPPCGSMSCRGNASSASPARLKSTRWKAQRRYTSGSTRGVASS